MYATGDLDQSIMRPTVRPRRPAPSGSPAAMLPQPIGDSDVLRFVALGDSVTVGIGDRLGAGWRGWAQLLAAALAEARHQVSFTNLAAIGATAAVVRQEQLPQASRLRPHLASLVVGINDTMRSTFDPGRTRDDLFAVADELCAHGARLLMVRFHDHGRVFGLPSFLSRALRRRILDVNQIYDEIHQAYGGVYVDIDAHPEVYNRAAWSVDRLHPSERGHRWLARIFAEQLQIPSAPCFDNAGTGTPTRGEDLVWLVSKGVPWVARRARDLGPWAVRLVAAEVFTALRRDLNSA